MSVSFNFRVGVSVALWSAALAAQLVLAAPAHAQAQMEFIPSVSLFTVYDDNIFARADGSAGQMMQLRPSFEGSWESPTVLMLGLYSFDMQRSNFSTLSTLDARRHALGEMRFRTTPFVTLGLTTQYDRTNTPGELDSGHRCPGRQAKRRASGADADARMAARAADGDDQRLRLDHRTPHCRRARDDARRPPGLVARRDEPHHVHHQLHRPLVRRPR